MLNTRNSFAIGRLAVLALALAGVTAGATADEGYGGGSGGSTEVTVVATAQNIGNKCIIEGTVTVNPGPGGGETVTISGPINATVTANSDGTFYHETNYAATGTLEIYATTPCGEESDSIFVVIQY